MHASRQPASASNFIRQIVESDLTAGKFTPRRWSGQPGDARSHAGAPPDTAKIRTRFPPEPNGYLHFGHAKSILLNFGLAAAYGGACHLRFDDTNPEKEEQEYVDSIIESVRWLGGDFGERPYYASDYFALMFEAAEALIRGGHAYVDALSAEEMRAYRGTLAEPGRDSPWRTRTVDENLALFREMRAGRHADGALALRAKIDMRSPNINLRDPVIYRIKRATHHRTGDAWCIYPTYTFAHPIEDALENITHSICTLEFEDQRPFYDWLLERLAVAGLLQRPLPQQIEFARLNLTYVALSKRKLIELVAGAHVAGWDDPRMPTLAAARRRGYTPEGFRLFAERIGVAKADSWIDYSVLEECMREHLNEIAPRRVAVLDPLKLVIENFPEGAEEPCTAPNHPQKPDWGTRTLPFSRELWIERDDYAETPPKGYFRLFPGNDVRLRYGFVVKCLGYDAATGCVRCTYYPDSKSGTAGADRYKTKGNIHWLSAKHAHPAPVRLYDRLYRTPHPAGIEDLNPASLQSVTGQLEPSLRNAMPEERFQFERHGYFVRDRHDAAFNRTVALRDTWVKR